ncbi:MAG: imidazole glycerol phosphate synthase subunit HisH [Alphaproteobacteria bacterium]|nr:imidazole glycerol phosphate synthase subunit HisH [Alphaproteobacteria bacterium]MCB9791468.1 imidazole glycerol phosphate synthase subunit HisH [Alphaproteobacteria bacterium]
MKVVIVSTGAANTASVLAGLRRAGADPLVSIDITEIQDAARLVLPGVGAFGAAKASLEAQGLVPVLQARLAAGRPTLCICLGLQLLAESSEESPGVSGLGVLPAQVTRFPKGLRVPQLGWNRVQARPDCQLLESGYAYYANSYRLTEIPEGWTGAMSEHGGPFVAALERGPVLACQFHPELSGDWGQALLGRWLEAAC